MLINKQTESDLYEVKVFYMTHSFETVLINQTTWWEAEEALKRRKIKKKENELKVLL